MLSAESHFQVDSELLSHSNCYEEDSLLGRDPLGRALKDGEGRVLMPSKGGVWLVRNTCKNPCLPTKSNL